MMDRIQHKLIGARGTVSFALSPGKIPVAKFDFTGLAVDPTEVVLPADFDTSAFLTPTAVTDSNTPTFTLDGLDLPMHTLDFDTAQAVSYLNVVNQEEVRITDRAPAGKVVIAEPLLSEKDFYTIVKNNTLVPLVYEHGTVAGKTINLSAPLLQLTKPSKTNLDGTAGLDMSYRVIPNLGDDDFSLTFT